MSQYPALWYYADPMCAWCWAFAPVISAIRESYSERLRMSLVLGGLRPGATELVSSSLREQILRQWQEVHRRTGQVGLEGTLPSGFVYDTEPPSRAVVVVAELKPVATFAYFESVQRAFFVRREDVTQAHTLAALAEQRGLQAVRFLERFYTEKTRKKTRMHFEQARRAQVRTLPTAVLRSESGSKLLTQGYRPFAELKPELDGWLAGVASQSSKPGAGAAAPRTELAT